MTRTGRGSPRAARAVGLVALGAVPVLLPLAVRAQPAFDLRRDLMSDLAAKGAAAPALGTGVIAGIVLAHLAVAVVLTAHRLRVAATGAAVAAVGAAGVAAVRITCPRGARGCSGPDSGRAVPKPWTDFAHRDLVAVLAVGALVLAVALGVHLARARRPVAAVPLAAAVVGPVLLLRQQAGVDIGWWQLSWVVTTLVPLLVVLLALRAPGRDGQA